MRFLLTLAVLMLLASPASARFESAVETPKMVTSTSNLKLESDEPAQSFPVGTKTESSPERLLSGALRKKDPFICYGASCTCQSRASKKNK